MTLKRPSAKITHKNAHLITTSDEKGGTMLFKALKTGFVELSVKPRVNVSCRLNFMLFVSCQ